MKFLRSLAFALVRAFALGLGLWAISPFFEHNVWRCMTAAVGFVAFGAIRERAIDVSGADD